ncbi:MAG TPA: amidohydrolase family protein [Thermoanaerobaculia bacterium]
MPGIPSVCLTAALALALAAPAPAAPATPEIRYIVLLAGNHAGSAVTTVVSDHEWRYTYELHDRGRGSSTTSHAIVDEKGVPLLIETTGVDYLKNALDERYERTGMKAVWRNASEHGERALTRPAFFPTLNGPPQEAELLARALLRSPDHSIDLLPDGRETIEELGTLTVKADGKSETIHLYSLSGSGFEPGQLWLDDQQRLFASASNWSGLIREGWESVMPEIVKAQDARKAEHSKELARRLARHPHGPLVFVHARLLDPARGLVKPNTTVVITGDRITAVGDDGQVAVPAGAETVDAHGRTLMPGLWDMHVHLSTLDGLFHLAAGVTTVRDMANDTDFLLDMRRGVDAGEILGPHIIMAGFIDSPGPYAGPSKVLVSTKEEALKAVDRYKELGYEQIKLYSSLDPALVPPIVERAHHLGMRVSGHIPNGMTAEQAVREGFDEIQHVNFLFLNFLSGFDTRTPERFTQLGAHAAELDLHSDKVKAFLALLKEKKTVSDPTVNSFEGMLTGRSGQIDPGLAPVADRLPPQVRRELLGGGLPVPPGMDQRYRDSFRALLSMVRALHDDGITIVAGTDSLAGFGLHRELELYGQAGIPNLDILRAATIVPAQVMKRDKDFGSIETGKMADVILVDGQPDQTISDIRRVVLTVKGGVIYDPAALYREVGVKPVE